MPALRRRKSIQNHRLLSLQDRNDTGEAFLAMTSSATPASCIPPILSRLSFRWIEQTWCGAKCIGSGPVNFSTLRCFATLITPKWPSRIDSYFFTIVKIADMKYLCSLLYCAVSVQSMFRWFLFCCLTASSWSTTFLLIVVLYMFMRHRLCLGSLHWICLHTVIVVKEYNLGLLCSMEECCKTETVSPF